MKFTESEMVVAKVWGEKVMESCCLIGTVSALQDERGSGDGLYDNVKALTLLNCALRMAKMVNVMLCVFYHNF